MKIKQLFAAAAIALLITGTSYAATYRLGSTADVSFNHVKTLTKTTTYTATTADNGALINADATSAGFTITMPNTSTIQGSMAVKVIKTDATTGVVTVAAATGQTIGGESARKIINQNSYMILESGPSGWTVAYESPYAEEDHGAGTLNIGTVSYGANVVFEGATADAYETTLAVTDPTADGTVTIPNVTGTVAMTGGVGSYSPVEVTTTTDVLTTADCGKTLVLNSATEFVTTLPAPVAGCRFKVVVRAAPASASYTVVTTSSANVIEGVVATAEEGASVAVAADADTVTFVDGKAIKGDYVDFISDGTNWFVSGMCNVQDGITTTQGT
jgi:hypothetical protein